MTSASKLACTHGEAADEDHGDRLDHAHRADDPGQSHEDQHAEDVLYGRQVHAQYHSQLGLLKQHSNTVKPNNCFKLDTAVVIGGRTNVAQWGLSTQIHFLCREILPNPLTSA